MRNIYVVDANVILRYLLADHPEHFQKAKRFLGQVKEGAIRVFIPEGVLIECVHVLLKIYKVPKSDIIKSLTGIMNYKGVINTDRVLLIKSLHLFMEKNIDIVDAIVHTIAQEKNWTCFTFEKDLAKL